jgi:Fe-S cluster assembly iron-binding protein IscA
MLRGLKMIGITSRAKEELKRILLAKVDMPQAALRLVPRGGGELGLGIDIQYPGDEVVEDEGTKVLIVEHDLASRLNGITLDVDDTPEGPELVICGAAS